MVLSTRDTARLGKWRDRQIIPAEGVRRCTSVRASLDETEGDSPKGVLSSARWQAIVWDGNEHIKPIECNG